MPRAPLHFHRVYFIAKVPDKCPFCPNARHGTPITSGVQNSYSFHLLQRSRHFSVYCGPLKGYRLLRGVFLHCPTSHSPSTQTQSHYLAQLVEQRAQSQNRRNYNRRKTPEHISMHHPVVFPETSKVSTLNARSF